MFNKPKYNVTFGKNKRKLSGESKLKGPGYLPQKPFYTKKTKNSYSFGKCQLSRTRIENKKMNFPGPGQYNSMKMLIKKHPRCVIGSAKRVLGPKYETTPGVGTYNTTKTIDLKKKRLGYSFGRRRRFKSLGVRLSRNMSIKLDHNHILLIIKK